MFLDFSGKEINFSKAGDFRPRLGQSEVSVSGFTAEHVSVHHPCFEVDLLLTVGDDRTASGLSGSEVEANLGEDALEILVGLVENRVRRSHARADHDDFLCLRLLPRVPEVEAEAARHFDPLDPRRVSGVLVENSESRDFVLVVNHRRAAADHLRELEHDLLVRDHDEVLRDREVVHHRRLFEVDIDVRRFRPVR
ncbi:hypothetical protein YC2023_012604 [Brassica napus]